MPTTNRDEAKTMYRNDERLCPGKLEKVVSHSYPGVLCAGRGLLSLVFRHKVVMRLDTCWLFTDIRADRLTDLPVVTKGIHNTAYQPAILFLHWGHLLSAVS